LRHGFDVITKAWTRMPRLWALGGLVAEALGPWHGESDLRGPSRRYSRV
jgi:hypothetical protein